MNKVKPKKAKTKSVLEMPIVNPYSAGIDISDCEHVVAVPEGLATERVKAFGAMTCDLIELADWLESCEIDTVAMESTGVYWKPLFALLLKRGFEVYLVNAGHVKNVSGRKDDDNDAMWIQKLHSCGLLRSCYLPDEEQDRLRTLVRFRRVLTSDCSRFILRMQKSLELMNVKLHTVISDIVGQTGSRIIEAILNGQRNAADFIPLIGRRIKASTETIIKSLEGNYREDYLFTLQESYKMYQLYKERIACCDQEIEKYMQQFEARSNEGEIMVTAKQKAIPEPKTIKAKYKNHPRFNVRAYLERIHGVDVLNIYGISEIGGLELLSELGTDMSKWKTEKHLVSWLNLCPNNKISGGKLISSHLRIKKPNAANLAFRQAANSVQKSDNWLGDYFRRMKARGGNKYAIVATANKIATIYYKMLKVKQEFNPVDLKTYEQKYKQKKIDYLERKLQQLKGEAA
jgi:transposase